MTDLSNALATETASMTGILLAAVTPKNAMLLGTFPMPTRSERGVGLLVAQPPVPLHYSSTRHTPPSPPACPLDLQIGRLVVAFQSLLATLPSGAGTYSSQT